MLCSGLRVELVFPFPVLYRYGFGSFIVVLQRRLSMKKLAVFALLCTSAVLIGAGKKNADFNPNFDKGDSQYSCESNCQKHNSWKGWFHTGRWSKKCVDVCEQTHKKHAAPSVKQHEKATKPVKK